MNLGMNVTHVRLARICVGFARPNIRACTTACRRQAKHQDFAIVNAWTKRPELNNDFQLRGRKGTIEQSQKMHTKNAYFVIHTCICDCIFFFRIFYFRANFRVFRFSTFSFKTIVGRMVRLAVVVVVIGSF
jgi:hypothetical protein